MHEGCSQTHSFTSSNHLVFLTTRRSFDLMSRETPKILSRCSHTMDVSAVVPPFDSSNTCRNTPPSSDSPLPLPSRCSRSTVPINIYHLSHPTRISTGTTYVTPSRSQTFSSIHRAKCWTSLDM